MENENAIQHLTIDIFMPEVGQGNGPVALAESYYDDLFHDSIEACIERLSEEYEGDVESIEIDLGALATEDVPSAVNDALTATLLRELSPIAKRADTKGYGSVFGNGLTAHLTGVHELHGSPQMLTRRSEALFAYLRDGMVPWQMDAEGFEPKLLVHSFLASVIDEPSGLEFFLSVLTKEEKTLYRFVQLLDVEDLQKLTKRILPSFLSEFQADSTSLVKTVSRALAFLEKQSVANLLFAVLRKNIDVVISLLNQIDAICWKHNLSDLSEINDGMYVESEYQNERRPTVFISEETAEEKNRIAFHKDEKLSERSRRRQTSECIDVEEECWNEYGNSGKSNECLRQETTFADSDDKSATCMEKRDFDEQTVENESYPFGSASEKSITAKMMEANSINVQTGNVKSGNSNKFDNAIRDGEFSKTDSLVRSVHPGTPQSNKTLREKMQGENIAVPDSVDFDVMKRAWAEQDTELPERLFVDDAGLVLLHLFMRSFFSNLDLLDENGQFLDLPSQERAVHLLRYLSGKPQKHYDHLLCLEKLLCGLPFQYPLSPDFEISEKEKTESIDLLQAVCKHWPSLRNTSVQGLQQTFIQRHGSIEKQGDVWVVHVESQLLDILMEDLPWEISTIVLPWLDDYILVDWQMNYN